MRKQRSWAAFVIIAALLLALPASAAERQAPAGAKPKDIRLANGGNLESLIAKAQAAGGELVFTSLPPCRVIDTRKPGAGGRFTAFEMRSYVLRGPTTDYTGQGGNPAGCGIPGLTGTPLLENEAKALAINIIAVGPLGPGDMRAWPANQAPPTASVINYSNLAGLNIANGIILPICDEVAASPCAAGDVTFQAEVAGTFLVADVTGYFHSPTATNPVTSVAAGTGLSGGGTGGDLTLSIDAPFRLPQSCTDGQIARWNSTGSVWECSSDNAGTGDITGVAADTGLTGGGTSGDVSLGLLAAFQLPQSCANGQLPEWNSGSSLWECANDDSNTGDITGVSADTGLAGGGTSGDVALSLATTYRLPQSCATGQLPEWNGVSGLWECANDDVGAGDITSVNAGTGLTGGAASGDATVSVAPSYQLPQTCGNGQVAKWNSTSSLWECLTVGGVGFAKTDIYENVAPAMAAAGTSLTNTVACNDANDIPLEGTCRPVLAGSDDVVIASEQALNWNSAVTAAQFRCVFKNVGAGSANTQTRILCVTVP